MLGKAVGRWYLGKVRELLLLQQRLQQQSRHGLSLGRVSRS